MGLDYSPLILNLKIDPDFCNDIEQMAKSLQSIN